MEYGRQKDTLLAPTIFYERIDNYNFAYAYFNINQG